MTAIGYNTKHKGVFQEGLRRIRNSDLWNGTEQKNRLLWEYMNDLRMSSIHIKGDL